MLLLDKEEREPFGLVIVITLLDTLHLEVILQFLATLALAEVVAALRLILVPVVLVALRMVQKAGTILMVTAQAVVHLMAVIARGS